MRWYFEFGYVVSIWFWICIWVCIRIWNFGLMALEDYFMGDAS